MLYPMLLALGLFLFFATWRRENAPWTLAALVLTGGAMGFGDTLTAVIVKLYIFKPGMMPGPYDHYLGMLFADKLFTPFYSASLLSIWFDRPYWWALVAALPPTVIEFIFLRTGVYAWAAWHSSLTFALFALWFGAAMWFLKRLKQEGYTPSHRALVVVGTANWANHLWILVATGLLELHNIRLYWWSDPLTDRIMAALLFVGYPFVVISSLTVWFGTHQRVTGLGALTALSASWLICLRQWGIWRESPGWGPLWEAAVIMMLVFLVGVADRWIAQLVPAPLRIS